jgi:LppP/LprE lipoprotein
MTRALATFIALAAGGGLLLGACGGAGTTVVTSSKPLASASTSAPPVSAESTTSSATSAAASTPAGAAESGGTSIQSTMRSASAPAYVAEESPSGELATAVHEVNAHGYTPSSPAEYHPNQTLRVLIGTRNGSAGGHQQQAFFFLGGHYLGTDTSQPSGSLQVVGQGDTEVTLAYAIYRPGDPLCCPSGGQTRVTFQLNNGMLAPAQAIPPVSQRR